MSTARVINVAHPSSATLNIVNDSSGNVAVGNNLTVTGTSTLTGAVTATASIATPVHSSPTSLTLQTNGTTTAMTIDTSQNVGIATTSPKNPLDVLGDISCSSNNGFNSNLYYSGGWKYIGNGYGGFMKLADSSGAITFNITSSSNGSGSGASAAPLERMRIDSSGNVSIATTSPLAGAKFSITQSAASAWTGFMQGANAYGCLGITNTSGTASYSAITFFNNGTSFSSCGVITVSGTTTSYNTSSDYRLKENVAPMTTGLATISALKPVTYDWISTKEKGEGFIAHELAEVIPQAVTGEKDALDKDGRVEPQGVDYSKIVVHLVAAIQELSAKNDALEARFAQLEAK